MPVAGFHALDRGLKARAADRRVTDAAGREIEPDAANPRPVHGVEIAVRGLVVDHGDAARGRAAGLHAEKRGRVVAAVDAGRNDHDAVDVQRSVQGRHFFGRGQFRGVGAPGEERKFLGIAVNMGVAIAGAGGNFEIHRRRRLWRCSELGRIAHHFSGNGSNTPHLVNIGWLLYGPGGAALARFMAAGSPAARAAKNVITAHDSEQAARKYSPTSKLPVESLIQPTMKGPK